MHRHQFSAVLPVLARVYGIRPWEVDQLTDSEIIRFLDDFNTQNELADPESVTNRQRKANSHQARAAAQSLLKPGGGD